MRFWRTIEAETSSKPATCITMKRRTDGRRRTETHESTGSREKRADRTTRTFSLTVSGGFATMHPNNRLTINAIEAYPLEDFSQEVSCQSIPVCLCPEYEFTCEHDYLPFPRRQFALLSPRHNEPPADPDRQSRRPRLRSR